MAKAADTLFSPKALLALQQDLDRYIEARKAKIKPLIQSRLSLKECLEIQKRHFFSDLLRNPINALWAIPYIFVRRTLEVSDKLGWETGRALIPRIPQSIKTNFQKEVEFIIAVELFGLHSAKGTPTDFELSFESAIKDSFETSKWKNILAHSENDIRADIRDHCSRQSGFTDLAASTGVVVIADVSFGDRSLDIFGLGKKIASVWAKKDAASDFFLGESLGNVFYSIAPPPPPTSTQVFISTAVAIFLLALFSTAVGVLSYPVQKKLGFRQKQLENLIGFIGDKLLLRLTKELKKASAEKRAI